MNNLDILKTTRQKDIPTIIMANKDLFHILFFKL